MLIRLKQIIGTCFFAIFIAQTVTTQAATYYVATTGSDSYAGTSTKPWKTIKYAVGKMVAGDTTYVSGGTYQEGEIRFSKSGTQSAPIKLLASPGASPIISFINKDPYNRINFKSTTSTKSPIGWITLEGFELRNGYDGIKIYNGHDITIRRNWIHHNPGQGILGNGTRILIDRNKINHNGPFTTCGTACGYVHGLYMNGKAITITNNIIYDNLCYGIQVNGSATYDSTKHPGPEYVYSSNWVIANNTLAYQGCAGIVLWSYAPNLRAENNVFYENGVKNSSLTAQGINFVGTQATGITIRNNLAYASGSGGTKFLGSGAKQGTNYTQSGNIVNTAQPKFVNAPATLPSSPNFSLASGSPAIDKGLALSLSSTKISYPGTTRPKGYTYDVGAYEYNGSTTLSSLAEPISAQAN